MHSWGGGSWEDTETWDWPSLGEEDHCSVSETTWIVWRPSSVFAGEKSSFSSQVNRDKKTE